MPAATSEKDEAMYASVRRYRIEPKNMDTLVKRLPGAVEVISKLNGFKAYYVIRSGNDTLATVSVFNDRATAEQSNQTAAKWVKENAADLFSGTPDIVTGEVVAHK
jgi:quinol monooxygenase YgiN